MSYKRFAVVGATGAVGQEMVKILQQRRFPLRSLALFASRRSKGRKIKFNGETVTVQELTTSSFAGIEIALFSAGSAVSREYAPFAVKNGCVVIDNTSAFRMDNDTPLIVPEVNAHTITSHHGIIANPNCSTIQMVVALKPLYDYARILRLIVTTFQAVSGAGARAIEELTLETRAALSGKKYRRSVFPHQIAFNVIPQIPQKDAFVRNGCTIEEVKLINETKKILGDDRIKIFPTCVRVPVYRCHSESINAEFAKNVSPEKARSLLRNASGVELVDDFSRQLYPLAVNAAHKDAVYVGRLRRDDSVKNGLAMWVVSDNVRKGAALNAVQIAELL